MNTHLVEPIKKYNSNSWQQKKLNAGYTIVHVHDLECWFASQKIRREAAKKEGRRRVGGTDESRAIAKERSKKWREERKNQQHQISTTVV